MHLGITDIALVWNVRHKKQRVATVWEGKHLPWPALDVRVRYRVVGGGHLVHVVHHRCVIHGFGDESKKRGETKKKDCWHDDTAHTTQCMEMG